MNLRQRIVLNGAFALTGAITNLLGPLLLIFIATRSISDARAGRFFLAQFVASGIGAASLGWIGRYLKPQWCLAASYLGMGCAVAALGIAGPAGALVCMACCGFAIGLNNPAANLIAAQWAPGKETSSLNLLSMCWSAGAIVAPAGLTYSAVRLGAPVVLAVLGAAAAIAAALTMTLGTSAAWSRPLAPAPPASGQIRRLAWITGSFLFLYIGAESACSGWLPTYSWRSMGFAPGDAGLPQASFWAAVLSGRLIVSLRANRATERQWITLGIATAVAGNIVLLSGRNMTMALAGATLAGLGMAPLFPTAMAVFQRKAQGASMQLIGYIFAASGFGGAVIPWAIGVLSSATGSLRSALFVVLGAALGMMLLARRL